MNEHDDLDDEFDDDDEDDEDDEDDDEDGFDNDDEDDGFDEDGDVEDEVGGEGNRIVGARARAVVEHVARSLVDDPDSVEVDLQESRGEVMLLIHASSGDKGRLIGKRGRVIQALRQVVRAAGSAEGVRAGVDVAE